MAVDARRRRSWGSGRSRPTGRVRRTPPRSRTPSTCPRPPGRGHRAGAARGARPAAAAHGFHAVIARIVGDHEASIGLHAACGFELVGHRTRGRTQVRALARRRPDATHVADDGPEDCTRPRRASEREWAGLDSNQRSLRSRFTACPLWPLGYRPRAAYSIRPLPSSLPADPERCAMPTFDVVSELDMQEVRNAVDQAAPRDRDPLRLQEHRQLDRAHGRRRSTSRPRARTRLKALHPGARGEAGRAQGVAEGARLRQDRGGVEGRVRQTGHARRGDLRPTRRGRSASSSRSSGSRACSTRSRATSSGSPARSATTCRPRSRR